MNLVQVYSSDVEDVSFDKFLLFSRMYADKKSVTQWKFGQINDKLIFSFVNVLLVV